jgi:hypothetical protein
MNVKFTKKQNIYVTRKKNYVFVILMQMILEKFMMELIIYLTKNILVGLKFKINTLYKKLIFFILKTNNNNNQ